MLTRIVPKSARQASSTAKRCLLVRYNSTQAREPTFSSPQNEPAPTSKPTISEFDQPPKSVGFQPKDPYRHPPSSPLDSKLPTPALRSLFALHHASRNFITPQTLDKAIDAAFATSNQLQSQQTRVEKTLRDLERDVEQRRTEDSLSHPFAGKAAQEAAEQRKMKELEVYPSPMRTSDGGKLQLSTATQTLPPSHVRELEVRAALYGVEQVGDATMPSLESLEDEIAAKKLVRRAEEARSAGEAGLTEEETLERSEQAERPTHAGERQGKRPAP
ncbi:hypothetical protein FRB90_008276 [Tulasnella sp. 427]|nr:hypothetical protein FRB90_008276 [Tulasnella sp. 427]